MKIPKDHYFVLYGGQHTVRPDDMRAILVALRSSIFPRDKELHFNYSHFKEEAREALSHRPVATNWITYIDGVTIELTVKETDAP